MNVSALGQHLSPQMVTQSATRTASSDGDGRTGAAALNDGDAAARAAAHHLVASQPGRPAAAPHGIDVKA
jgi:hypothetical protein